MVQRSCTSGESFSRKSGQMICIDDVDTAELDMRAGKLTRTRTEDLVMARGSPRRGRGYGYPGQPRRPA